MPTKGEISPTFSPRARARFLVAAPDRFGCDFQLQAPPAADVLVASLERAEQKENSTTTCSGSLDRAKHICTKRVAGMSARRSRQDRLRQLGRPSAGVFAAENDRSRFHLVVSKEAGMIQESHPSIANCRRTQQIRIL